MFQRLAQAVAFGQEQGAVFDALGEVAALLAGAAIGFLVFQGPRVFFAQAHRFGQPALVQVGQSSHVQLPLSESVWKHNPGIRERALLSSPP